MVAASRVLGCLGVVGVLGRGDFLLGDTLGRVVVFAVDIGAGFVAALVVAGFSTALVVGALEAPFVWLCNECPLAGCFSSILADVVTSFFLSLPFDTPRGLLPSTVDA
jgi:hypothetical protein